MMAINKALNNPVLVGCKCVVISHVAGEFDICVLHLLFLGSIGKLLASTCGCQKAWYYYKLAFKNKRELSDWKWVQQKVNNHVRTLFFNDCNVLSYKFKSYNKNRNVVAIFPA